MDNKYNNNVLLAVEESVENKPINVRFPNNDLYKLSRYIVAIGTYLECRRLMGPTSEYFEGEEYTFDFYDPEKGGLYKVFDKLSGEYKKYARHPSKPTLIVNVEEFTCRYLDDLTSYEFMISFGEFLKDYITNLESTYLYFDDKLWRFQEESDDGTTIWQSIVPSAFDEYHIHACEVDEDEESWLEEENRKLNESEDEEDDDDDE